MSNQMEQISRRNAVESLKSRPEAVALLKTAGNRAQPRKVYGWCVVSGILQELGGPLYKARLPGFRRLPERRARTGRATPDFAIDENNQNCAIEPKILKIP